MPGIHSPLPVAVLSGKLFATLLEGCCSPQPLHGEGSAKDSLAQMLTALLQCLVIPEAKSFTLNQLCPSRDQPELT